MELLLSLLDYSLTCSQLIEDGYAQAALALSEATLTPLNSETTNQKGTNASSIAE
jgi:hypothetical protein